MLMIRFEMNAIEYLKYWHIRFTKLLEYKTTERWGVNQWYTNFK